MSFRWAGIAVAGLALGLLASGPSLAEDPKAAAQSIGQAGLAKARSIARNAASADAIPGYAGTGVPERGLTAAGMEAAANARLADTDDPGGVAGRAVVEGTVKRPAASVPATDPAVARTEAIAAAPQVQAHGASGLASGSASGCGAALADAQSPGSCGAVRWCVGADCESASVQANTGFVNATAKLNMVTELGGEEFDRDNLRFFSGQRRACTIRLFGLANCCKSSGLLVGLASCSAEERELAQERNAGNTRYLGKTLREAHLLRGVHPPRARVVRVRLEARAHPPGAGAQPVGRRLGGLPGAHRRRGRAYRLRPAGSVRVYGRPDGGRKRALDRPARGGGHPGAHAHARARALPPGALMAPGPHRLVVAVGVALVLTGPPASVAAGEWRSWCGADGASLGWHFYCDRDEGPERPAPAPQPPDQAPGSATERILEMRRVLEEARATAILEPTTENVAAYLHLQQETLGKAAAFSDASRRTVWATPALDYTLKRPVGALAKRVWSDERRKARDAALRSLSERYGLIYLGHRACAACKVAGPLLRAFAERHDLDVLAVSMTGEPLEGWPEAVADNGRAARLGLSGAPVPAVVLYDTKTKQVLPVGFGVLAEDQLTMRIFALTALEPGHDY